MSLANILGESDSRSQGTWRKAATPGLEEEPVGAEAEAALLQKQKMQDSHRNLESPEPAYLSRLPSNLRR